MSDYTDLYVLNNLFTDYRGRFIRFARLYVRDEAVAEDFVMEAIMQYWNRRETLRAGSNIPAYILTVIKNKCLNHLEHLKVCQNAAEEMKKNRQWELQTRIASLSACDPEELFSGEAREIVDKTLVSLPAQTRELYLMSRHENKSNREIATHFGISVKGVEYHISKALKALRKNLRYF